MTPAYPCPAPHAGAGRARTECARLEPARTQRPGSERERPDPRRRVLELEHLRCLGRGDGDREFGEVTRCLAQARLDRRHGLVRVDAAREDRELTGAERAPFDGTEPPPGEVSREGANGLPL